MVAEPHLRRLRRTYSWLVGVALCAAIEPQLLATGPNLLSNPTFDSGLTGWSSADGSTNSGTASWTPSDSNGSVVSGSARLFSSSNGHYGLSQCVAVVGSTSYIWGATAWIPSDSTAVGVPASVYVEWFQTPNCTGNTIDTAFFLSFYDRGRWVDRTFAHVAQPLARSALFVLNKEFSAGLVYFDNAFFGTGTCAPNSTQLCLNQGRFQVQASWTTPDQNTGPGMAVPFADESGSFWFFSPTNIELDVKVLNACVPLLGNHFWVFAAGLTDVKVVLTVTDTQTGFVRTYNNPQGTAFQPITDTRAFTTCP